MGPSYGYGFCEKPLRTVELWPELSQLISHVGQHMDEHAVVTKAIFGVNTSGCQGERTNHVSIESVIFGTYIIYTIYIHIFMYILQIITVCLYHSSQVLPRVFVIELLRWIISRCILSF